MTRQSDNTTPEENAPAPTGRCPICGKSRVHEYRPFCSKRCADIDLGRWLKGRYVIAGSPESDEDGDAPASAPEDGGGEGSGDK